MNTTDKKQAEIARLKVRASRPQIIKYLIDGKFNKKTNIAEYYKQREKKEI